MLTKDASNIIIKLKLIFNINFNFIIMNDPQYLIFDIVCDYLKNHGLNTCLAFRLVSKECKNISTKLFNSHFSAYIMNKILLDSGFDKGFIDICLLNINKKDHLDYIKWLIIELYQGNHDPITYDTLIKYKMYDIFNPIKNASYNKMVFRRKLLKRTSLIFALALDWAEQPRYILRSKELETM